MARLRRAALDDGRSCRHYSGTDLTARTLSEEPGLRERFSELHRRAWPRVLHGGLVITDTAARWEE